MAARLKPRGVFGLSAKEIGMAQDEIATLLRTGLRRFAKAVAVITTRHHGQRMAMTATAVSEISMTPPSMLVCVNKTAGLHVAMESGEPFCINILHVGQADISALCAGKVRGEARFEVGDWVETASGVPRLAGAQASIVCRNQHKTEFGSHSIFIGLVDEVFVELGVDPLLYVDGGYSRLGDPIDLAVTS